MYEAFLRKQILDHSSNDKRYIKTVLGGLTGICSGWRAVGWLTQLGLPQSFYEPRRYAYSRTVYSEGGDGWVH